MVVRGVEYVGSVWSLERVNRPNVSRCVKPQEAERREKSDRYDREVYLLVQYDTGRLPKRLRLCEEIETRMCADLLKGGSAGGGITDTIRRTIFVLQRRFY